MVHKLGFKANLDEVILGAPVRVRLNDFDTWRHGGRMERDELLAERARLTGVLDGFQNVDGKGVETYGPDASGDLTGITTAETRDALERRLGEIDRKLSPGPH